MALDEALWRSFHPIGRPTLRLYRWSEPALSIGYSQQARDFDLEQCTRLGIAFVRRPTGGRAVLHHWEVTYSLIHPLEGLGSVEGSHRLIAEALAVGLRRLELPVELEIMKVKRSFSEACFEAPAHSELTVAGKKVAGMSQVRDQLALLEQGSIPLELDVEQLAAVIRLDGFPKEEFIALLRRRAAGLRDFAAVQVEEVESALVAGFIARFGVEFEESSPTAEELELAKELLEQKYEDPSWNLRR
jgi:lipoate-protein ligase A